jgi:hypothetical protein
MSQPSRSPLSRKRILIVNCYFDYDRARPRRRHLQVAQAMGHAFLAGAVSREHCDLRIHNEQSDGPLTDRDVLAWPDMLVLTGVTAALDRMRQLTACVRTLRPDAAVVAGGPAVRAFPALSRETFDYACLGDVEELGDVIRDAFGAAYAAERFEPRVELVRGPFGLGYIETSRYCNFACSFCSLSGEGRRYQPAPLAEIERQARALGRRRFVLLLDNTFLGNDRASWDARLALLGGLHREGVLPRWGALVTGDFFAGGTLVERVREAGCFSLFSGVESFDPATLARFRKRQNASLSQAEVIKDCLERGVVFSYGLMADVAERRVADLRAELEAVMATPEITLPSFVTLPVPLPGTPYFRECVRQGRFLPSVKLRDLEGSTITLQPRDPLPAVAEFVAGLQSFAGYRGRMARHSAAFIRRYRRTLSPWQLFLATSGSLTLGLRAAATGPRTLLRGPAAGTARTHIATTEAVDAVYTPPIRIDARWEHLYAPTMLTDMNGDLHDDVVRDLGRCTREQVAVSAGASG